MKYEKQPLTLEQQADQLITRGLVADRQTLINRLRSVNYYRLSGYLYPFRVRNASGHLTDQFAPGTDLDTVWRRYNFDRRLRILLMDAIERIEVSVRTKFVYNFVLTHGPFGYINEKNLPGFKNRPWRTQCWRNLKSLLKLKGVERSEYKLWLGNLQNEQVRAGETFVKHFRTTYGDSHKFLPLWMACELMTCGSILQFINGVDRLMLKQVAAEFGFPDEQLRSWTKAIFSLRNACAHHARIWNKVFGLKPSVPGKNKNPNWHIQQGFEPDRVGLMMTVCYFWLTRVSQTTQWKKRVLTCLMNILKFPPPIWASPPTGETTRFGNNNETPF